MPKIISSKLISKYHNDLLASFFGINKIKKLINPKYYWLSFKKDVKTYIKSYNVYLILKMVRHKPYNNL